MLLGSLIVMIAWASTATAVSIATYFTQSPWCMLAFIFPTFLRVSYNADDSRKRTELT